MNGFQRNFVRWLQKSISVHAVIRRDVIISTLFEINIVDNLYHFYQVFFRLYNRQSNSCNFTIERNIEDQSICVVDFTDYILELSFFKHCSNDFYYIYLLKIMKICSIKIYGYIAS